jgi:hypothetical protein
MQIVHASLAAAFLLALVSGCAPAPRASVRAPGGGATATVRTGGPRTPVAAHTLVARHEHHMGGSLRVRDHRPSSR